MSLAYAVHADGLDDALLLSLAKLRISVFRSWPYLYDGSLDYERAYLSKLVAAHGAVVVTACFEGLLAGAATACPLAQEHAEFRQPFVDRGIDPDQVYYFAESVLLPGYRGQGAGYRFFELREHQARLLRSRYVAFCAVVRPVDHPARSNDGDFLPTFWRKQGFLPAEGMIAHFAWRDIGDKHETEKPMQFWIKKLN
jgi:GNAT superfamily N-acetyltransferase